MYVFTLKAASGNSEVHVPSRLWDSRGGTVRYGALGGRDVLILAPDLSLPHPETVARRPSQLTEEDKLKLQSQGLPTNCQDEQTLIKARYKLDKEYKIVEIKSGQSLSQDNVLESIVHLLNTTQNDGGKLLPNGYCIIFQCTGPNSKFCTTKY